MSAEIETLHRPFKLFLATLEPRVEYTYHRSDKPTGGTVGDADFILYRNNRVLHIEFKDKETKVSKEQIKRHEALEAVGCKVHILRDIGAACELVLEWARMVGEPPVKRDEEGLVRYGNSVCKQTPTGLYVVRPIGPGDERLPSFP